MFVVTKMFLMPDDCNFGEILELKLPLLTRTWRKEWLFLKTAQPWLAANKCNQSHFCSFWICMIRQSSNYWRPFSDRPVIPLAEPDQSNQSFSSSNHTYIIQVIWGQENHTQTDQPLHPIRTSSKLNSKTNNLVLWQVDWFLKDWVFPGKNHQRDGGPITQLSSCKAQTGGRLGGPIRLIREGGTLGPLNLCQHNHWNYPRSSDKPSKQWNIKEDLEEILSCVLEKIRWVSLRGLHGSHGSLPVTWDQINHLLSTAACPLVGPWLIWPW